MTLLHKLKYLIPVVAAVMSACDSANDERIPSMAVRIAFNTAGEWNLYGIAGATDSRRFILSERQPSGFPYNATSATGYGGVLIVGQFSYSGNPQTDPPMAYDLACPVEMKPTVRITVDRDKLVGRCNKCGSTYDIFEGFGGPLSGPAATSRYALRRYRVSTGSQGQCVVVTN